MGSGMLNCAEAMWLVTTAIR